MKEGAVDALLISDSVLYAAGFNYATGEPVPGYWKGRNFDFIPLQEKYVQQQAPAQVKAILIVKEKLYAAGFQQRLQPVAGYWEEGAWTQLPIIQKGKPSQVNALGQIGSDIIAAGFADGSPGYWRNGKWNALPVVNPKESSTVTSVAVNGEDIYFGGVNSSAPGYWKNAEWQSLPAEQKGSVVNAIVVRGTDVFAGGANGGVPGYWKNKQWVALTGASPSSGKLCTYQVDPFETVSAVKALVVLGDDVFAGGFVDDGSCGYNAGYWQNTTWHPLKPSKRGLASKVTSLVVVP